MGIYQFKRIKSFSISIDKLWGFISNPKNLKLITPDYMDFDITSQDLPDKMYEGMIISYKAAPVLRIKTNWVTEITHVQDKKYFVDEQRGGLYKIWHHQHFLESTSQGTLMKDIVSYKPPFGFPGKIANTLFIRKKLEDIITYRTKSLNKLFQDSSIMK